MAEVIELFDAHSHMTVEQAIETSKEAEWGDVIVFGYNKKGEFCLYSSHMDNKEALMLAKLLETRIVQTVAKGGVE